MTRSRISHAKNEMCWWLKLSQWRMVAAAMNHVKADHGISPSTWGTRVPGRELAAPRARCYERGGTDLIVAGELP